MIKVLENAKIHFQRVCWHVPVEYNGDKYMILCDEDDNGAEHYIYTYDENSRHNVGEEYWGDDYDELYEKIVETMMDACELHTSVKKGTVIELQD